MDSGKLLLIGGLAIIGISLMSSLRIDAEDAWLERARQLGWSKYKVEKQTATLMKGECLTVDGLVMRRKKVVAVWQGRRPSRLPICASDKPFYG